MMIVEIFIVKIFYLFNLLVNHANGYLEEKKGNKYLIFHDSVNENKALLKNKHMFCIELKTKSKQ